MRLRRQNDENQDVHPRLRMVVNPDVKWWTDTGLARLVNNDAIFTQCIEYHPKVFVPACVSEYRRKVLKRLYYDTS